jgi:hypothetical protein
MSGSDAYGIGQLIGKGIRWFINKKWPDNNLVSKDDPDNPNEKRPDFSGTFFVKQSQSNFSGPMCSIGSCLTSRGGAIQLANEAKRREPNTLVQVFDGNGALIYSA